MLLLTVAGPTWASWWDRVEAPTGGFSSGSVNLAPTTPLAVQLLSRQPVASRTYASGTTCTVPSGYVECRVVTTTLPQERLIPGDTVRLQQQVTLAAQGSNLTGVVRVDAREVTLPAASALSAAASVSTRVTPPGGTATPITGGVGEFPVVVGQGSGVGTYAVVADVVIPASGASGRWGTALRDQPLVLGTLQYGFEQQ